MHTSRKQIDVREPGINPIIIDLTISDVFVWGGYNLVMPIVAIFLADRLGEDAAQVVGVGTAIYFLARSVLQIPVGWLIDRLAKYTDEAWFVAIGSFLMALGYYMFQFIYAPEHLYIAQFVFGVGASFNIPAWRKLFSKFLDRDKEGIEWSLYGTITSLSMGIAAAIGGAFVLEMGYTQSFNIAAACVFLGGVAPLLLFRLKKFNKANR